MKTLIDVDTGLATSLPDIFLEQPMSASELYERIQAPMKFLVVDACNADSVMPCPPEPTAMEEGVGKLQGGIFLTSRHGCRGQAGTQTTPMLWLNLPESHAFLWNSTLCIDFMRNHIISKPMSKAFGQFAKLLLDK